MKITQIEKDNICNRDSEAEALKLESRIVIDGKVYLIQRHFIGKRDLKEAVFTVVKNDAERVLLDVS